MVGSKKSVAAAGSNNDCGAGEVMPPGPIDSDRGLVVFALS
jgi:hypothetical protein